MAEYVIQDSTLTDIADAIREKTGGSSAMTPAEMVTAIGSISGGGDGLELTSDFVVVHKETVEVGENAVTDSWQYANYLASIKSIPGTFFAMSIHKKASYTYNEWANGNIATNAGYRYRYGWQSSAWNQSQYDAVAPVGTLVDVYTVELKNPSKV